MCRLQLLIFKQKLCQTNLCKVLYPATLSKPVRINCVMSKFVRTYCEYSEVTKVKEEGFPTITKEQLQDIARQIRDKAGEIDKMVLSVPLRIVTQSLKTLTDNGFSVNECLNLASNPVIIKNFSNFSTIYSALMQYGYEAVTVTQMFRKFPELVTLQEEQLVAQYESLRGLGFTDGPLEHIVSQSPDILLTDLESVSARFSALNLYFKNSDVIRIFEKCPGVFREDVNEIDAKILYAKGKMDATNRQMLNSNFFQHSLAHIETRHTFVVRAGFWRIAKKKEIHFENPLLKDILDTSDEEFVKTFGNMTVQDYATFKKLFEKEKEKDIDNLNPMFNTDDAEDSD